MVVRSRERFLDYVFQITPETEITSQVQVSSSLEPGQWVTVEYRKDRSEHGPPAALRVVVPRYAIRRSSYQAASSVHSLYSSR